MTVVEDAPKTRSTAPVEDAPKTRSTAPVEDAPKTRSTAPVEDAPKTRSSVAFASQRAPNRKRETRSVSFPSESI
jgi:hypothetical protein